MTWETQTSQKTWRSGTQEALGTRELQRLPRWEPTQTQRRVVGKDARAVSGPSAPSFCAQKAQYSNHPGYVFFFFRKKRQFNTQCFLRFKNRFITFSFLYTFINRQ